MLSLYLAAYNRRISREISLVKMNDLSGLGVRMARRWS